MWFAPRDWLRAFAKACVSAATRENGSTGAREREPHHPFPFSTVDFVQDPIDQEPV